jgi:hypothetical protein
MVSPGRARSSARFNVRSGAAEVPLFWSLPLGLTTKAAESIVAGAPEHAAVARPKPAHTSHAAA